MENNQQIVLLAVIKNKKKTLRVATEKDIS